MMNDTQASRLIEQLKRIADALERVAIATETTASPAVILPSENGVSDSLMKDPQSALQPVPGAAFARGGSESLLRRLRERKEKQSKQNGLGDASQEIPS